MANAAPKHTVNFLGFDTAQELKAIVLERNRSVVRNSTVALVRDRYGGPTTQFHVIVRTSKADVLYLILPDSKALCFAKFRQERKDVPFLFEVLA